MRKVVFRCYLSARIPQLEGEAVVRVRRRSSLIVGFFRPFRILRFLRGYTSPSFHPATPFLPLSYLSARIPTGFSSTLTREGREKGVYAGKGTVGSTDSKRKVSFFLRESTFLPLLPLFFSFFTRRAKVP